MRLLGAPTVCLAVALLSGCGSEDAASTFPAVSDSAGVRIVRHPAHTGPRFTVGPEPMVEVGREASDSLTLFRVGGGVLLPDGRFVVADGGNYRLLVLDSEGRITESWGSEGEGPGEMRSLEWLQVAGEGITVYDARNRRLSRFHVDRGPRGSIPVRFASLEDPPSADAILGTGHPMAMVGSDRFIGFPRAVADPKGAPGPLPVRAELALFDSTSSVVRALGPWTVMEWWEDPDQEGLPLASRLGAPRMEWSAGGDLAVITDEQDHRIDVLRGGRRSTVILEERERRPFTPDSLPEHYDLAVDSLEAYHDIVVDGERRIWVKPAVADGVDSVSWRAFGEDGTWIGLLTLPRDAVLLDATETRLLLLRRTAYDEEYVEVRSLEGPDRAEGSSGPGDR